MAAQYCKSLTADKIDEAKTDFEKYVDAPLKILFEKYDIFMTQFIKQLQEKNVDIARRLRSNNPVIR